MQTDIQRPEQKQLLDIVAANMRGQKYTLPITNYEQLLKECSAQAVLLQVFDTIPQSNLPEDPKRVNYLMRRYAGNLNIHNQHAQLHRLLEKHGIDYCVLKGSASAYYYPNPTLRAMGDVDFLVAPDAIAKTTQILKEEGFTPWEEEHICHVVLYKPGAHLEMHFEPAGMPDGKAGQMMRQYLSNIFEEAETVEIDGMTFRKPSDFHHGLILLMHTYHHMLSEGVGVRHLTDWSAFISSLDEDVFANLFEEKLKAIGLWQFAKIISGTAHVYLGAPYRKWMGEIDRELCGDLMEDILSGGNFGKKDGSRVYQGLAISDRGKDGLQKNALVQVFASLNALARNRYHIMEKLPFLLPIGWLLICFRRIGKIWRKELSMPKLAGFGEKVDSRKKLYHQFKLFETEEP